MLDRYIPYECRICNHDFNQICNRPIVSSTLQVVRSPPTLKFVDMSVKTLSDACMLGALNYRIDCQS